MKISYEYLIEMDQISIDASIVYPAASFTKDAFS